MVSPTRLGDLSSKEADGEFIAVYAVIGTAAAFFACFVMDRYGRRQLFSESVSFYIRVELCSFQNVANGGALIKVLGFPILAVNLLIEGLLQRQYLGSRQCHPRHSRPLV